MENIITDKLLFDKKVFSEKLKKSSNPLSIFKEALNNGYEYLTSNFIPGENIEFLVKQQTWLIDQLLMFAWRDYIHSDELSLIAVGGYGRAELSLGSDIDLMILKKSRLKNEYKKELESFIAFLWDFGLEVGHSVRTLKECRNQAKKDITIMTNIMESRLIIGNEKLFNEMLKITSPKKIWTAKKFFESKLLEQKNRHKKYNHSEYKLEPNIKESPGGLRDIQMIAWVAKRHFDNINLKNLISYKFLSNEEYETLRNGRNLLFAIRFGLHMIAKRREDRLLFDYQKNIAELFGFKNNEKNKGIEDFMKMYFKTVREISRLNEILLQHFQEDIIYKKNKDKIVKINSRFQKRNDLIEIINESIFERYPYSLFEIFLLIQQDPKIKGVRATTIRSIRKYIYLIDKKFRNDVINKSLFIEILKQPNLVGHKLRLMHKYGILGAYMPAFSKIEGLMQFDLYHIFTVDEHILRVIRNLRLFGLDEYKMKYPICYELVKTIPKLELLYLAGFFHDIAKGRNGDHSKLGSKDALEFCQRHGFSEYDRKLVAWLVDNHLLMSKTSQREDLDDPSTITSFAKKIGDQNRLNYLYVLTVADICGTNPELWNSWRESLLANLYHKTLHYFRKGSDKSQLKSARVKNIKDEALKLLNKIEMKAVNKIWKKIDDDYFLRHNPDEVAWHTEEIINIEDINDPLVSINKESSKGGSLIFVYMRDKRYIFTIITRAIAKLGLTILDARIITNRENYTLDTFVVLEKNGDLIKSNQRCNEIKNKILDELNFSKISSNKNKIIPKRKLKSFLIETKIIFENDKKNNRTIMEVITNDRPGVLSCIGEAMDMCGVKLQGAKITTFGERVEDIFYIQDFENNVISNPIKFECLEKSIIKTLS